VGDLDVYLDEFPVPQGTRARVVHDGKKVEVLILEGRNAGRNGTVMRGLVRPLR
jgi:hypothetical protein